MNDGQFNLFCGIWLQESLGGGMQKVCIYALDDGTFSVELESQGEAGGAEGMETPASPVDMQEDAAMGAPEQAFTTVDEALDAARTLLAGDGADPMGADKPLMEGEADFVAGFKQARGGEGAGF